MYILLLHVDTRQVKTPLYTPFSINFTGNCSSLVLGIPEKLNKFRRTIYTRYAVSYSTLENKLIVSILWTSLLFWAIQSCQGWIWFAIMHSLILDNLHNHISCWIISVNSVPNFQRHPVQKGWYVLVHVIH